MMSPQERWEKAVETCPGVSVSQAAFEAGWHARVPERADERYVGDVLLAVGIEAGDAGALKWLTTHLQRAMRTLSGTIAEHSLADVESNVLTLVAVAQNGAPPRIRGYTGRGPLAAWLQVIVARTARAMAAGPSRTIALDDVVMREFDSSDLPLDVTVLRNTFREDLGAALKTAIARLDPKERALLTLHYLQGVGLDEIGRAYQVHRATVSRWLLAARESFREHTRDEVAARVKVGRLEVDSLVRALHSQLDLSLRRVVESGG